MREQEIRKLSLKVRIYSVMLAVICAFWFMSTAVVLTTGAEGSNEETSTETSQTATEVSSQAATEVSGETQKESATAAEVSNETKEESAAVESEKTSSTSSASSNTSSDTTSSKVRASDYQTVNLADTTKQSAVSKVVASKNIKIKAGKNVITGDPESAGVYFNVSDVSADDKKAIVALLKEAKITKDYVMYDFSLKYANSTATIDEGSVQITANVPKEWKTVKGYDVVVYHYENKKLTKIKPSSVSDKGIVFETTSLSPFITVRTSTGKEVENVKTGDSLTSTVAAIYLAAISIFMIAVVSIKLKVAKGRLDQVRRTAF